MTLETTTVFGGQGSDRWGAALRMIGTVGAVLAFAVLAASISLRLTTVFAADGSASSDLPSTLEAAIRLVHRIAAAGLGILTLVAGIMFWKRRGRWPQAGVPVAWMVACTLLLSVIGPLTPGYRLSGVTIANVVAGTALLMACWGLRVAMTHDKGSSGIGASMVRGTLVLLLVHIGLGAAASAWEVRGVHWVAYLHTATAMLVLMLVTSILWERRAVAQLRGVVAFSALLLACQVVGGMLALWMSPRPIVLSLTHGLLSALIAGALVSIAAHMDERPQVTPKN